MIKKYQYDGQTYYTDFGVRQAIWNKQRMVFGPEPAENPAAFWQGYGVSYTEEPDPEPSARSLAAKEIRELKDQLRETDYAVIKIAEGAATAEEYSEVIAQRETWRARINELEAVLEADGV